MMYPAEVVPDALSWLLQITCFIPTRVHFAVAGFFDFEGAQNSDNEPVFATPWVYKSIIKIQVVYWFYNVRIIKIFKNALWANCKLQIAFRNIVFFFRFVRFSVLTKINRKRRFIPLRPSRIRPSRLRPSRIRPSRIRPRPRPITQIILVNTQYYVSLFIPYPESILKIFI